MLGPSCALLCLLFIDLLYMNFHLLSLTTAAIRHIIDNVENIETHQCLHIPYSKVERNDDCACKTGEMESAIQVMEKHERSRYEIGR
jgi:hypothetical protein